MSKPLYTHGICQDGAAILKDGVMMTIEEVLQDLNASPWIPCKDRLPERPNKDTYQMDAWLCHKGRVEPVVWNYEHECWDDRYGDDYMYPPSYGDYWMPRITPSPPDKDEA